jgi:ribosome-associated protein
MNLDGLSLAEFCAQKCLEKKAENVLILDLQNRSPITDFFVICSGFSDRQVMSIAEHVAKECKASGLRAVNQEGLSDGRWALLDFSSVIVHVFQDHLRDFYSLEDLWKDAKRIRVSQPETMEIAGRAGDHQGDSGHTPLH